MKYFLITITVLTLFTFISCNQTKQNSGQTEQAPVSPTTHEQKAESTDSAETVEANPAQQSSEEQNNEGLLLNPPHGEPNHRCDIAVGAPLNSAPVNTTRQTTNSQVQTTVPDLANNPTAPTVENAKRLNSTRTNSTAAPATGAKPRLNPAHGQPWHRCDVAVGSPLP